MPITKKSNIQRRLEIISTDGTIILKQYALEDAKEAFALIDRNRKHLSQFDDKTADKYPTLESFEESIRNPKNVNRLRFGIWNTNGVLVGSINLTPDADNPKRGEIGYYLGGEFQHNGYMEKATRTLTYYAFNKLNYEELYAKVTIGNETSAKVLKKSGYIESGVIGKQIVYKNSK